MAYKRSYTDFREFVRDKKNENLTRTQMLKAFREQGGKIQKQRGLDIMRDMYYIQKGEDKRKQVKNFYENPSRYNRVKITKEYSIDKYSPAVQDLQKSITKVYGKSSESYIQVRMKVKGDGYSKRTRFSILIPNDEKKKKFGVKTLANQIIKSTKSYYSNLAKLYSNKNNMSNKILPRFEALTKDFKKSTYTTELELYELFGVQGFDIDSIEIMNIDPDYTPKPAKTRKRKRK